MCRDYHRGKWEMPLEIEYRVAGTLKQHIPVVGKRDVVYGLARMWETPVDEANITARIFRTREEADDWIAEMKIQRTSL